ncbi:hypothetical protein [Bradyrhizobium sp. DOA1]|uniref:hypothetical protein n=1 Tax=Bradyrhizobium sp. DOA1 TaxID=1126616 RepID=UPI00077C558C|nr:hypothetical protein [Bradyrhizobium sp. DOA1]KYG99117.1 hypothetical protein SE91_11895 [Bradyrhizobium sp. DOA1]
MIYATDTTADKKLLSRSHELVREAMALLRTSDHLVSRQRMCEMAQERGKRRHQDGQGKAASTDFADCV